MSETKAIDGSKWDAPEPGEHFALGGPETISDAEAVIKIAADITRNQDPEQHMLYPTGPSRAEINRMHSGEDTLGIRIVNKTAIAPAREELESYKPKVG